MVEAGGGKFLKAYLREYNNALNSDRCGFGVFDVAIEHPNKRGELQRVIDDLNDGFITTLEATALGRAIVRC